MLTIPSADWEPRLPDSVAYIRGQQEIGEVSGYQHWQLLVVYSRKVSILQVKSDFGERCHAELSRSEAADSYVWKDDTAVPDTRFELGTRAVRRNSVTDWESVWECAKRGDVAGVPANVRVQHYRTLRSIQGDFDFPLGMERTCYVFWGRTGTGKSRAAWDAAGMDAYPKDPRWLGLTLGLSSGAATVARNMLSSTNLEEVSTSVTSSGGWTATQSRWSLRDPVLRCEPNASGLHRTLNPPSGIPAWMARRWPR